MKIIYLSAGIIPSERANSIQVMKVCQAFTQLGHSVTLLVPATIEPVPAWDVLAEHYGLKTRFDIQALPLTAFMQKRDFPWKAANKARQLGANLVYARSVSLAAAGLLSDLPVILEMHQLPSGTLGPTWFRLFLWLKGRKRLVPITTSLALALRKHYHLTMNSGQIVVAASGVDLDRFSDLPDPARARQLLHLPEGWTVVCSGHLYKGRGLDLVIDLAKRLPDVHFLWVGGSAREVDAGRGEVLKYGLQNLHLTGFVPNSKLPLYQAAAEALLIPYSPGFTNSGGEDISDVSSPMKIFEYMASGRVIVSSDLPVLREVLNEKNAIFCPPEDVDAWELKLRQLRANSAPFLSLADQARGDAEKYSWIERSRLVLAGFMEDHP